MFQQTDLVDFCSERFDLRPNSLRGDKKVVGVAKVGWRKKGGGGEKEVARKG